MKPAVIAVSGVKNSGKTTFIEHIIPLLTLKGLRTAVIKHDGHSFTPDVEGTDSFRIRKAGAVATAVYCEQHYMIVQNQSVSEQDLMAQFTDVDLIICEGLKKSRYKKFEIVRQGNSEESVCDRDTLLAVVSDLDKAFTVPRIGLNEYHAAVELILEYIEGNRR